MKKVPILIKIILIILLVLATIGVSKLVITAQTIAESPTKYSYTKAICDSSNNCEDYVVECDKNSIKNLTPTGQVVQKDKNWIDERENKENLCD